MTPARTSTATQFVPGCPYGSGTQPDRIANRGRAVELNALPWPEMPEVSVLSDMTSNVISQVEGSWSDGTTVNSYLWRIRHTPRSHHWTRGWHDGWYLLLSGDAAQAATAATPFPKARTRGPLSIDRAHGGHPERSTRSWLSSTNAVAVEQTGTSLTELYGIGWIVTSRQLPMPMPMPMPRTSHGSRPMTSSPDMMSVTQIRQPDGPGSSYYGRTRLEEKTPKENCAASNVLCSRA